MDGVNWKFGLSDPLTWLEVQAKIVVGGEGSLAVRHLLTRIWSKDGADWSKDWAGWKMGTTDILE